MSRKVIFNRRRGFYLRKYDLQKYLTFFRDEGDFRMGDTILHNHSPFPFLFLALYIKVSLLLDDFVILTKKSADVDCSTSDPVFNSTFVFNALSSAHTGVHLSTPNVAIETNDPPLRRQLAATISDLSRLQEGPINDGCLSESPPSPGPMRFASDPFGLADSTNELSTVFPRQLRELSKSDTKAASSRLFYNNMGALISVRTKTSYGMKRVLGRVFVGKTQFSTEDGLLHWAMMTKNHREFIHKTHLLSLDM